MLLTGLLLTGVACNKKTADMLLINGNIYTVNDAQPAAEAVAVIQGHIVAVGSDTEILKWKDSKTRVIDLQGKTVTPGFIEGHAHFMGIGRAKLHVDLLGVSSYEQLISKVKEAVEKVPPGTWITGRGWHQDKWDSITGGDVEGFPVHELLSRATPDNPVYLSHASGHAALVNAKAMVVAGVTADTKFTDGGEIIRDGEGIPTGIFVENAMGLIGRHVPEDSPEMEERAFELATEECISKGITGFCDAGQGTEVLDFYKKKLKEGAFKLRLYVMLDGSDDQLLDNYFNAGPVLNDGDGFLTIRSVKLFADGALGSRGAWLLEPYTDMPGAYGQAVTDSARLGDVSERALVHGFQVCTHAIGDRANREVLNIYGTVFEKHPEKAKNSRFRIEHAQHLDPADIPRFAALGVIPAMQAIHMSSDRPWAIDRLGRERIEAGAYVWQKLLKTGAHIVNGTDAPVEPVNPLPCFYASVSRRTLSGYPLGGFEPDQKMTRAQALKSYTLDAAYGVFQEKWKGSIEPGRVADFTVFDHDIMTIPEDDILSTKVVMTIVNGKVVWPPEAATVEKNGK